MLRDLFVGLKRLGIVERSRDLLSGQPCAIITFDQQSDAATVVDVARPADGLVELAELLIEMTILLQGSQGL